MKYAIVEIGGKQIKIAEGRVFEIERQKDLAMTVLMYTDGKEVVLDPEDLKKVEIKAKVVQERLGDKVVVARFKAKSRYRKKKGHRQPTTVVRVDSISVKGGKKVRTPSVKSAKKAMTTKTVKKVKEKVKVKEQN